MLIKYLIKKGKYVYIARTIITSISNVLLLKLYSVFFLPEEYGKYSLIFYGFSLLSSIILGFIDNSALRFYNEYKNKNKKKEFLETYFYLFFALNLILITIVTLVAVYIYFFSYDEVVFNLLVYLIIFVLPNSISISLTTFARAEEEFYKIAVADVGYLIIKIVFLIIGVKIFNLNIEAIVLGSLIGKLFVFIFLLRRNDLADYIRIRKIDEGILKHTIRYGLPLMGLPITNWILGFSDRYIINNYFSSYEVGLYSITYTIIANVFSILTLIITTLGYPTILRVWNTEGKKQTEHIINRYLSVYIVLSIPAIFGLTLLSEELILLLSSENYITNNTLIIFTSIGLFFSGLLQFTNKKWELSGRTDILFKISIITAAMNILLNIIFVPLYGYIAAAVTTSVAYFLSFLISSLVYRDFLKIRISVKHLSIAILGSIIMSLFVVIVKFYIDSVVLTVLASVLVGVMVYLFICEKFKLRNDLL